MIFNDATDIKLGSTQVEKAYLGTSLVWQRNSSNVTPNMTHIDTATFLALNNATDPYDVTDARCNLASSDTLIAQGTSTYEIGAHYHLVVTGGMYEIYGLTELIFSGHTYTKIIFKTTAGSQYQNIHLTCTSGRITYDASADEYVWTGNTSSPTIRNTGNDHIKFYDLYYE